jgi:hypothetical protein
VCYAFLCMRTTDALPFSLVESTAQGDLNPRTAADASVFGGFVHVFQQGVVKAYQDGAFFATLGLPSRWLWLENHRSLRGLYAKSGYHFIVGKSARPAVERRFHTRAGSIVQRLGNSNTLSIDFLSLGVLPRCPLHKYTASACGFASFPRKRESRRRVLWGLDARLRGHDVLLAPDLRNRHLGHARLRPAECGLTCQRFSAGMRQSTPCPSAACECQAGLY